MRNQSFLAIFDNHTKMRFLVVSLLAKQNDGLSEERMIRIAHLESEMMGSFHVSWLEDTIWRIEFDEGFSLDDLLHELAMLEQKSVGYVKHGYLLKL